MRILAFDTTQSTLSVAILEDQETLSKSIIFESGKQSEVLIPEIEKNLRQNNIWYDDLDLIAATKGPGSFTGVRIGLSVARTLKLSTNLPLILLDSLEVLGFKYHKELSKPSAKIIVAIDARMNELFIAGFSKEKDQLHQIEASQLINIDDIKNSLPESMKKEEFLLCGNGKNILSELISKEDYSFTVSEGADNIEADLVGILAYEKFCQNKIVEDNSDALYLRDPKISKRKEKS